jgi:hypothetical protein
MKQEMRYGKEHQYQNPEELIQAIHEHNAYHNQTRIFIKLKASPLEYCQSILIQQSM